MDTFPAINEQSTAPIVKVFTFFRRFVLKEVNEAETDSHVSINLHIIDMCNAVLQSTGYVRYSRKMTPEPSLGTLHALHISLNGLYIFTRCVDDSNKKNTSILKTRQGDSITSLKMASSNPTAVFETCIDMQAVEGLCAKRKVEFDNKIIITSSGIIHLQVTYNKKESSHPFASSTVDHKAHRQQADKQKDWDDMAALKQETNNLYARLKGIKAPVPGLQKTIKDNNQQIFNIVKSFRESPSSQLMEDKKTNKKKAVIYNNINVGSKYIGVDPGVKTMASAVIMNSEQAGTYLLLSNKYAVLEQHLDNKKDARKKVLKFVKKEISVKSIISKARIWQNRIKLQGEKKKNDNVLVVEKHLSELGEKSKPTIDILTQFYHQPPWMKKIKNGVLPFRDKAYTTVASQIIKAAPSSSSSSSSSCAPTATTSASLAAPATAEKWKGKGKKITAPTTIHNGDDGRGFGSKIHGQERRSTDRLQMALYSKSNTKLINTNEYLSSKLCCLCDSRVQHPKRRNGRANLGVVHCINPDCFGRKHGYSLRGRDANAAINIIKIGIHLAATNLNIFLGRVLPGMGTLSAPRPLRRDGSLRSDNFKDIDLRTDSP
ncbi:hypothetical protein BC941DRAFT_499197 [Chlamydoabsidia padenii]|nr:hypothetical protein BC941DRAFT_499197 [Chlamydoabsidia padenii]